MRKVPKQEVLSDVLENLKDKIWQLPHLDRVAILACSIIANEREAFAASSGLVALAAHMARGYGAQNKLRLAEFLRSTADALDYEFDHKEICDVGERD
jgi:hypothetical protein